MKLILLFDEPSDGAVKFSFTFLTPTEQVFGEAMSLVLIVVEF